MSLAVVLALIGLILLAFLRWAPGIAAVLLILVVTALAVDLQIFWFYRPVGSKRVDARPDTNRLSVLIANVQLGTGRSNGCWKP